MYYCNEEEKYLEISELCFFGLFFLCQKYHNILYLEAIDILEEKKKIEIFSEAEWNEYKSKKKLEFNLTNYYKFIFKLIIKSFIYLFLKF